MVVRRSPMGPVGGDIINLANSIPRSNSVDICDATRTPITCSAFHPNQQDEHEHLPDMLSKALVRQNHDSHQGKTQARQSSSSILMVHGVLLIPRTPGISCTSPSRQQGTGQARLTARPQTRCCNDRLTWLAPPMYKHNKVTLRTRFT
jgi:hypothetical protein